MGDLSHKSQFYGRRKTHALRPHHQALMRDKLPSLRINLDQPLINSNPDQHRVLEIGFGGGEHLAHQAMLSPQTDFIGAEPFINGIAKLLALIETKQLTNIRLYDGDAHHLLDALPDRSLDKIYLLYPDPWPKRRHHRRRFVSSDSLEHFHRLLRPGGMFLFASDINDYIDWTLWEIRRHGKFFWDANCAQDWREPFSSWIETRYEAKAKLADRLSTYLTFRA